jgi:flagellar motor switch/type III secretory pathway protein FliN
MSNRQADALRIEVLGGDLTDRTCLVLKTTHIASKRLKKLEEGSLIDGFDPLHLRIVHGDSVIARAKLGQIGRRESVHIVSLESQSLVAKTPPKHVRLEARLRLLPDADYAVGDLLEYDELLSRSIVILADGHPVALGEMVDYDNDVLIRITRVLSA